MPDSAPKRPVDRIREPQVSSEDSQSLTIRPGTTSDSAGSGSARRRQGVLPMPMPGDRVDVYALEADIGAGGMGAVFRALDCRLDRLVALKLLPPEQANDSDVVQRFYQEARAAARLDHENIARVYSIGHESGYHYIAFEYIEGQSIRQKVASDGPLSVAETVNYTLQITSALIHASERGVVHRDIKPSNIVVTPHGRAKLVDMGLARRFERGKDDDDGLTQPGTTLGTFDYISPEQARDPRDVDIRSDLYSLGCTIYHMLTGSPPFPEGTVTQKLLQHQKEPAPDVRASNPSVPADLAAIVSKLMAKERDRRYQTPELLVRDLLTVAGALGLRSVSPEGLVWMSAAPGRSWERHLVWGLPTVVLAAVVVWLVWWSGDIESASNVAMIEPVNLAPVARPDAEVSTAPPPLNPPSSASGAADTTAKPAAVASPTIGAEPPAERVVSAGEDLGAILAAAPSGTIVTLADDGPFNLRPALVDPTAKTVSRDLIIRAGGGARPVLKMSAGRNGFDPKKRYALIAFRGGRLTLEGLEIIVPAPGESGEVAGLALEGTDLTIRRCLFRQGSDATSPSRGFALRARNARAGEDRPPPIVVQDSHFDRDLVAIHATGPADVQFRQCAFGPGNPSFWFENSLDSTPSPARLGLSRVSVLAGDAPILRAIHCPLTVRVEDSIFAPPQDSTTTLAETDMPDRLEWLGRSNLYARVKTYLQPILGGAASLSIDQFDRWAGDSRTLREIDSRLTDGEVWAHSDPLRMLAVRNPSAAFQLDAALSQTPSPGAMRGPWGPIPRSSEYLGATRPRTTPPIPLKPTTRLTLPPAEVSDVQPMPVVTQPPPESSVDAGDEPVPMERPMIVEEPAPTPPAPEPVAAVSTKPLVNPSSTRPTTPPTKPEPLHFASAGRSSLVHTSEEFRAAFAQPNLSGTTTILLASSADLSLPTIRLGGKHHWKILGALGADGARPIVRFVPEPGPEPIGDAVSSLFEINHAGLEVRGVDFVVDEDDVAAADRASAFLLARDSHVRLDRCSVTILGETMDATVFSTFSGRATGRAVLSVEPSRFPTVAAENCLFRGEGDFLRVSRLPMVNAQLTNSAVVLSGNLLHALGLTSRAGESPMIDLTLKRLHVRAEAGLIHLESDPAHPALPLVKTDVTDSILTTGRLDRPLIRIDGQESLDALADQLDWRGRGVVYDDVEIYRRDQSALPGSIPQRFDRVSWDLAVGMGDTDSFHGNARLLRRLDPAEPLWNVRPRDLRLSPTDEFTEERGPHLDEIAQPNAGVTRRE